MAFHQAIVFLLAFEEKVQRLAELAFAVLADGRYQHLRPGFCQDV